MTSEQMKYLCWYYLDVLPTMMKRRQQSKIPYWQREIEKEQQNKAQQSIAGQLKIL